MNYKDLTSLVSNNRYPEVFSTLKIRIPEEETELHSELAIIEGMYNAFKKKERLGVISDSDSSIERSKIAYSLLEHIDSLKKKLA